MTYEIQAKAKTRTKKEMWGSKPLGGGRDKLVAFENADKGFHEVWAPGRNPLDFPHPFRALLTGPPNTGKSTTALNILVRATPAFDRVIVVHADPEHTKEYDSIKEGAEDGTVILVPEIPPHTSFEEEVDADGNPFLPKTLMIIDDLDLRSLNKRQKENLDRLLGYVSTHRSVSVIVCTQDAFNLPASKRRMIQVFVIWRSPDMEAIQMICSKVGVKNLQELFDEHCKNRRDSIWIDTTVDTPFPLRLNGFSMIK